MFANGREGDMSFAAALERVRQRRVRPLTASVGFEKSILMGSWPSLIAERKRGTPTLASATRVHRTPLDCHKVKQRTRKTDSREVHKSKVMSAGRLFIRTRDRTVSAFHTPCPALAFEPMCVHLASNSLPVCVSQTRAAIARHSREGPGRDGKASVPLAKG